MAKNKSTRSQKPVFSVIIPCQNTNDLCPELIPSLENQTVQQHEIIVVDDSKRKGSPGEKRDWGAKHANGKILAFIDSDAFPAEDWLEQALAVFETHPEESRIAAVGGPGLTPESNTWTQRVSGTFFGHFLTAGPLAFRHRKAKPRAVKDYPTSNLLVRTSDFKKAGGFDTALWPGEDTKLCQNLTQDLDKIIWYSPAVVVYHHRKPILLPHLRQVARFGQQRGYFARVYPATSRKFAYIVPSLLLLGFPLWWQVYLALMILAAVLTNSPLLFPVAVLSHASYGIFFLKGVIFKQPVGAQSTG